MPESEYKRRTSARNLAWVTPGGRPGPGGRWHCAGKGIHAGDMMQLRALHRYRWATPSDDPSADNVEVDDGPGPWMTVRIESRAAGRTLVAHHVVGGIAFSVTVGPEHEVQHVSE